MARYILQSAHLISNFCVNLFCLKSENQGAEEAKITTKVVSRSPVPTSSYPPTKLKKASLQNLKQRVNRVKQLNEGFDRSRGQTKRSTRE
ncbi:uncharacterized protein LOC124337289 isoform X2 [Daphnia pulicaria]|uniref:uncharacterized protein LOC124337289 isoform X2 n=1 Tax=Daphnia pulicaria TaxID=35523 RepID=UPI001EEC80B3|nr:uncharacterized protein LOC124337289 isoform X2 [Daphnia pulicaria]